MRKTAVIVDGGYFTKSYTRVYKKFPSGGGVWSYVKRVHSYLNHEIPGGKTEIFRVFFYDCRPLSRKITNPVDKRVLDLSTTEQFRSNQKLQSQLICQPLICLRLGDLMPPSEGWRGWSVKQESLKRLATEKVTIEAKDIAPSIKQKGVDMRIGLDIAHLAVKRLCDRLILISADTDMIPAMKLARKEGLQVFLHTFGSSAANLRMALHADALTTDKDLPRQ